jgi:hypothetical protein
VGVNLFQEQFKVMFLLAHLLLSMTFLLSKHLDFYEKEWKSPASSIPLLETTLGRSSIPSHDAPRRESNQGLQATPSGIHWLKVIGGACV